MDTIELRSFDWIVINTSAGKDSQTVMRHVVRQAKESGVDSRRIVAVHADLGRIEWPGSYKLAGQQAEHYGLRFEVTKRNGGDLLEYALARGKWPSPQQRWCTSDFKRGPIRRVFTALTNEIYHTGRRPVRILNVMGMRAQESPKRRKMEPYAFDPTASNGKRQVWNYLAIHPWLLEDVWTDIQKSGVPHHEVYDRGMPRLSCSFCIFMDEPGLKLAGSLRPDLLDEYVKVQQATGHKFKANLDLVTIQTAVRSGEAPTTVTDWRM